MGRWASGFAAGEELKLRRLDLKLEDCLVPSSRGFKGDFAMARKGSYFVALYLARSVLERSFGKLSAWRQEESLYFVWKIVPIFRRGLKYYRGCPQ